MHHPVFWIQTCAFLLYQISLALSSSWRIWISDWKNHLSTDLSKNRLSQKTQFTTTGCTCQKNKGRPSRSAFPSTDSYLMDFQEVSNDCNYWHISEVYSGALTQKFRLRRRIWCNGNAPRSSVLPHLISLFTWRWRLAFHFSPFWTSLSFPNTATLTPVCAAARCSADPARWRTPTVAAATSYSWLRSSSGDDAENRTTPE